MVALFHGYNHPLSMADIGGQKLYNDETIIGSQYTLSWKRRGIV
jgi:hypothetical protein